MKFVTTLCLLTFTFIPWSESLLVKVGYSSEIRELIVGDVLQFSYEFNSSWTENRCFIYKDDLGNLFFPPFPIDSSKRPEGWSYKRFGDETTECGIEVPVTDRRDNGVWTFQSWSLNLTVKVPPSNVLGSAPTTVLDVDQITTFNCSATNSRPIASVIWTIDGEELPDLNDTSSSVISTPEDLFDVHDMLTLSPKASFDGKTLQCTYYHDAMIEPMSFDFNLTVYGPPDPEEFEVNYPMGLVLGHEVRFEFQVHSNPPVGNFTYMMHDLDNPIVIEFNPTTSREEKVQEGRYNFEPITENGKIFTSVMIIDKLLSSDVDQEFNLTVTNERGSTSYSIKFENPETVGLSSGAIAGIVIGAFLGVAIVGFLAFYLIKVKKVGKKKKQKSKKNKISNPVNTSPGAVPN